ncbi:MAG TPA: DUF2917 domain-containing protein [Burkholderiaceae bacterium]|nr:DUF2917 domain-containing protein [Burkholderiaceae bacterium]
MNPNTLAHDDTSSLFTVDANPVRLRLPIGGAIFIFSGEVWITQEGLQDDMVLGPGERFDVKSCELILVSGLRGHARIYAASAIDINACVDSDLFALLRLRARRLRAEYVDRVAHSTSELMLSALADSLVYVRRAIHAIKERRNNRLEALWHRVSAM